MGQPPHTMGMALPQAITLAAGLVAGIASASSCRQSTANRPIARMY